MVGVVKSAGFKALLTMVYAESIDTVSAFQLNLVNVKSLQRNHNVR